METITLCNQKGGVGKSTTALQLASGLHHKGYNVLMIDIDPQSNLSATVGANFDSAEKTLYHVFRGNADIKDVIQPVELGLDIAGGGILLSSADMEFSGIGRETILRGQLGTIKDNYDFCIIDTPPTLGVLTANALTASDKAIIPLYADAYSLQGMTQLKGFIESIQRYYNSELRVDGLLLTKYSPRTTITQVLSDRIAEAAQSLNTKVYSTKIRATVQVQESQLMKQDLYTASPDATATADYLAFVVEFLGN